MPLTTGGAHVAAIAARGSRWCVRTVDVGVGARESGVLPEHNGVDPASLVLRPDSSTTRPLFRMQ